MSTSNSSGQHNHKEQSNKYDSLFINKEFNKNLNEYDSLFINKEFNKNLNEYTINCKYDSKTILTNFNSTFEKIFDFKFEDLKSQYIKGNDFNKKLFTFLYYFYSNVYGNDLSFYTNCEFIQILIKKIFNKDNNSKTWTENKKNHNSHFSEIHYHFLSRIMFVIEAILKEECWAEEQPYLQFLELLLFTLEQEAITGIFKVDSSVRLKSLIITMRNDKDSSIDYNNAYISNSHLVEHVTRLKVITNEARFNIGKKLTSRPFAATDRKAIAKRRSSTIAKDRNTAIAYRRSTAIPYRRSTAKHKQYINTMPNGGKKRHTRNANARHTICSKKKTKKRQKKDN